MALFPCPPFQALPPPVSVLLFPPRDLHSFLSHPSWQGAHPILHPGSFSTLVLASHLWLFTPHPHPCRDLTYLTAFPILTDSEFRHGAPSEDNAVVIKNFTHFLSHLMPNHSIFIGCCDTVQGGFSSGFCAFLFLIDSSFFMASLCSH